MKQSEKPPRQLVQLQKWFGGVISKPITSFDSQNFPKLEEKEISQARKYIASHKVLKPEQRIAIYKQQYWLRLIKVLKKHFPFLLRLFGHKEFEEQIAIVYLQKFPPNHWTLNQLGSTLPQWILQFYKDEDDKELVYLASLIDEAYNRLFWTIGYPPISKSFQEKKLYLQPFVELFEMPVDLFSFRALFLEREVEYWEENDFPNLVWDQKHFFVLYRNNQSFLFKEISSVEFDLLRTFQKGAGLTQALAVLTDKSSSQVEKHLVEWFSTWTEHGWLYEKKA